MRRREFITRFGCVAAAWPLAAHAQQPERMRRIGVLMGFPESDLEAQRFIAAFRDGLHKLGWTEGSNVRIDTRWATPTDAHLMRQFAKELVALQPDLILSHTTPTTTALLQQTHAIPIVFVIPQEHADPPHPAALLRPRRQRPRCRAAERGDEFAPSKANAHLPLPRARELSLAAE